VSNLEVVQGAYEAFGRGDVEAVAAVMDPQIEWMEADVDGLPYAGTHHGVEAVVNDVFAQIPTTYDNFSLVPQEWVDGGDTIVMLGEITLEKDDRRATQRVAQVWTMRDGRAVRFEAFQDTLQTTRVLGG
jgi:hypothetical protein